MSFPTETFETTTLLRNYIQSKIVENNERGIKEEHVNNIFNSMLDFIVDIPDDYQNGIAFNEGIVTNDLITGKSGGQTIKGGTSVSENLTLTSTGHATKGKILFGTSAYDEVNNRLGLRVTSPLEAIHAEGNILLTGDSNNDIIFEPKTGTSTGKSYGLGFRSVNNSIVRAIVKLVGSEFQIGGTGGGYIPVFYSQGGEAARFSTDRYFGVGVTNPSAIVDIAASTTARASLRIRTGVAPTSPNAGDVWYNGTNLYFRNTTDSIDLLASGPTYTFDNGLMDLGDGVVGLSGDLSTYGGIYITGSDAGAVSMTGLTTLDFSGNDNFTFATTGFTFNLFGTQNLRIGNNASGGYQMSYESGLMSLRSGSNSVRHELTSTSYMIKKGSVGDFDFIVNSNEDAQNTFIKVYNTIAQTSTFLFGIDSTNDNIILYESGDFKIKYGTSPGSTALTIDAEGNVGIKVAPIAALHLPASDTTRAQLCLTSGVAPTTPNDGDVWYDGTNVYMRISGTTKTFTLA